MSTGRAALDDVNSHLLIVEHSVPNVDLAILAHGLPGRTPCQQLRRLGGVDRTSKPCQHIYGKAVLAHVGPHQINIVPSAFSPPRSLDRSNQCIHQRKNALGMSSGIRRRLVNNIRYTLRNSVGYYVPVSCRQPHSTTLANCYICLFGASIEI